MAGSNEEALYNECKRFIEYLSGKGLTVFLMVERMGRDGHVGCGIPDSARDGGHISTEMAMCIVSSVERRGEENPATATEFDGATQEQLRDMCIRGQGLFGTGLNN